MNWKSLLQSTLLGATAIALGACTTTTDPSTSPPSATVTIQEWSAAYYGSAATGKGELRYEGELHPFTISGLGAGGIGAQAISATGRVYNLDDLNDFAGTYQGVSSGLTLIDGTMHAKLTNDEGVIMYLAGETEGLASSMGLQAFVVTLVD